MTVTVIYGADLIKAARKTDLTPSFVSKIDPKGWNLVTFHMMHNDASEIRAMMMFKLKGVGHPVEERMTIDYKTYREITQQVDPDSASAIN